MRRVIVVTALLMFVAISSACSSEDRGPVDTGKKVSNDASKKTSDTTVSNAAPPKTTARSITHESSTSSKSDLNVGDTASTKSANKLTVYSYESPIPPPDEYTKPDPGKEFAAIDVEGCATPSKSAGFNPFDFTLQMPDNTRLEADIEVKEPALHDTTLTPGDCVRGWITFQTPQGERPGFVIFTGSSIIKWTVQDAEQASKQPSSPSAQDTSPEQSTSAVASTVDSFVSSYYEAVGREDWSTTYFMLDSESQAVFTEDEWIQKQIARNTAASPPPLASAAVNSTTQQGTDQTANVTLSYDDGSQEVIDIVIRSEGGEYKRHLTADEIAFLENL